MSIPLPESPVRKIHKCPKCGKVSVKFFDPVHDRAYSSEEWDTIVIEGQDILKRILKPVAEHPIFFLK